MKMLQLRNPKSRLITKLACPVVISAAALNAHAAISVVNTGTANTAAAPASSLTVAGFTLGAGNAIAVMVNSESTEGDGSTVPNYSVTFGGEALTSNVFTNQGAQGSAIYWAINPSITSGDVVVNGLEGPTSSAAISVLSLSDVLAVGVTDSATATSNTTLNLNYVGTAGGFVLVNGIDNRFGGDAPTLSGDNFDTYTQQLAWDFGGGSAGMAQGYGDITADGSFTESYTPAGGSSSRNAATLAAFVAIPEPSVALFGGLGVLGLLRRRRAE